MVSLSGMRRTPGSTRPTVVDLFAGAGLFSYAFKREGFDVVQAVEIDRHAAATYARNFGDEVTVADVRRVRPTSGRCDVIIAGPPCQGFSTLGKRDARDPRNYLSLEVVRWARVLRPRVIVIENVAAFLKAPVWAYLARLLRALGYNVRSQTCNAADFGVAQTRTRSVTFAVRKGDPIKLTERRRTHETVARAWYDLPRRPNGKGMDFHLPTTPLALARMRVIPPGGDRRDILDRAPHLAPPSWKRRWTTKPAHWSQVTDVWGRMLWDQPANTLRTEWVNPSKGRYIHPTQHRVMTLREAARLHSIPDGFEFATPVPYIVARQIGNSVPPLLGRAIAREVRRHLG